MRKCSRFFISILSLFVVMGFLSSCKDDEPVAPPELSFSESAITVNEADGIIEIEIVLDKPAKEDITIEYSLDGTAIDKVSAGSSAFDYEIISDYLEVDINEGETSGIIEIQLLSDYSLEDPETIQIEIESVDSDNIEITNDDDVEITVEQEDGLLVILDWDYTTVDMDLFLWVEDNANLFLTNVFSARGGPVAEFLFLPNVMDDGQYGISCNYYDGPVDLDPMNFTVDYITIVDSDDVATVRKLGSYKPININPWDTSGDNPLLVATYQKAGGAYSNFSEITIPPSGSRMASGKLPTTIKKQK